MVSPTTRVVGACIFGCGLVAVSFYWGATTPAIPESSEPALVVATAPERRIIQEVDSNNDGTPDWKDALASIELPTLPTATSTYTAPETLTGQFGVQFFEQVVTNKGIGSFGSDQAALIEASVNELIREIKIEPVTRESLAIIPEPKVDASVTRDYFESIARTFSRYQTDGRNELAILKQAIERNDAEILVELDSIITAYRGFVTDISAIPVPEQYAEIHVNLLNVLTATLRDIEGMKVYFDDPLRTLLHIRSYEQSAELLLVTLSTYRDAVMEVEYLFMKSSEARQFLDFKLNE